MGRMHPAHKRSRTKAALSDYEAYRITIFYEIL